MRVEPCTVGCVAHCLKRGGRGLPIVQDEKDRWRFVRSLYYLNDLFFDENWNRLIYNSLTVVDSNYPLFHRPNDWPNREPLVKILCYILMPNHVHLLLKETRENGISVFMKKIGQSMTNHFNDKYKNRGSIFQGAYKARTVTTDEYLRYLAIYIMVKNAFELFPGGLDVAKRDFERAWDFAVAYPFSSLADYVTKRESPVIQKDILGEIFSKPSDIKSFSREVIEGGRWEKDKEIRYTLME